MQRRTMIAVYIFVPMFLLASNISAQTDSAQGAQRVDPVTKLWVELKAQLISAEGQKYFEENVKDSQLPLLAGKLVSAQPPEQPSILTLAMHGSDRAEVTLHLKDKNGKDSHLLGPVMPGSRIVFEGIGVSFTQEPFMLTFDVSTDPKEIPPVGSSSSQHLRLTAAQGPAPGEYWQVVATSRQDAEIVAEVLTKRGFSAQVAPAPRPEFFLVLVGPSKDAASQARTRTSLEAAGFKNPILRKY